ncbi:MAG TPA: TolC family protein, partial [Terriglobia bacterium]|nr:TolC family protein [Terriglobia bacterium]
MKRLSLLICAVAMCRAFTFAANTATISLDQAVRIALQKNPDVAAANALVDAARANVKIAHANYLP